MSTLSTDLALTLAEHGLRDAHLAAALEERAGRAQRPAETARLLRAALSAGADGAALEIDLADALALGGDCASAATRADNLLGTSDAARRAAAVRVAASVATHDGNTGQAAELFGWLVSGAGPGGDATVGAAAVIVFVAAGQSAEAREVAAGHGAGPPTLTARATRSLAEGLLLTLDRPYAVAAARLGQALGAGARASVAMPDSAPALVTLAALHAGDAVRARSVIGRTLADGADDPMFAHRHHLLQAWTRMQDGQLPSAAADVAAVSADGLHRRDALWLAALQTGIARRTGDSGALSKHFFTGLDVLAEYSIDLFCLLPLGELWVAAARLRQTDRLSYALDQAFGLLRALGDPQSWSLPLHWAGRACRHPDQLTRVDGSARPGADRGRGVQRLRRRVGERRPILAAGACPPGRRRRGGHRRPGSGPVRPDLGCDPIGGPGCAAGSGPAGRRSHAPDRPRPQADDGHPDLPDEPGAAEPGGTAPRAAGRSPLSEREREVAELLLLGMPYRDIGAQLFISAKTVEHHVARIRRRLGAESRSEMLSMLRAMLAPQS